MAVSFSKKGIQELVDGTYTVEKNLVLQVRSKRNTRLWIFRYTFNGQRKDLGIGSASDLSITQAKAIAQKLRDAVAEGRDPKAEKAKARELAKQSQKSRKPTFSDILPEALQTIESVKLWRNKKHTSQWKNTLEAYAVPVIGKIPVDEISRDNILEVLESIWTTKTETASRLRGRLEAVFSYAITKGLYKGANPAVWKANLELFLPIPSRVRKVEHHASMPYEELQRFVQTEIVRRKGYINALILFTILTASRIGESAPAKWEEFDLENKIWCVPPERRKDGKPYPHRVPLSERALELLRNLRKCGEFVFWSRAKLGHIQPHCVTTFMKIKMDFKYTIHGMRSSFRDWCAENGVPDILAEKSLMHATGSEVVQAYQRSDLLEQRREVMEKWAEFLFAEKPNALSRKLRA